MFIRENNDIKPSETRIWLSSPTMHPESKMYMNEAFDTNWVSTVGACEKIGTCISCGYGISDGYKLAS